jgi:hypothetical protein
MNMMSPQRQRLVVIGNGMAGMRTVEELLKRAPQRYEITVFGAEPHPNYDRIALSSVLAGEKTLEQIVINSRAWYAENDIDLQAGASLGGKSLLEASLKGAAEREARVPMSALVGAGGELERRRLDSLRTAWTTEAGLGARLAELAPTDPMLQPLRQALTQRSEGLRLELDGRLAAAGLDALPATVAPSGDLEQALDLLWHDPDPDTAGWVLMLAREREPQRAARLLQDPRPGLASSPFLESQRRGQQDPDREDFAAIAASPLFADLLADDVLWVAREGSLRTHPAHAMVMERGAASDELALVLSGALRVQTADGQSVELGAGQTVGEMGVITGAARSATVTAAGETAALRIAREGFVSLVEGFPAFSLALVRELAVRLENTNRVLAAMNSARAPAE